MAISSPSPTRISKRHTHDAPKSEVYAASLCPPDTILPNSGQYTFAVLTECDEIKSLLPEWRALFSKIPGGKPEDYHVPPFSRPDVLVSWATVVKAEIKSLFVVTMRDKETYELRGVFPGFFKGRSARLLTDLVTDYQDITANSVDDGIALIREVIEITRNKGYRLAFHKVSDSSLLWECLQALSQSTCGLVKRLHGPCPHRNFEIQAGEGDFLQSLSRKRRKNHKAAASKIRQGIPDGKVKHLWGEKITADVIEEISTLHINNQYRKSGQSIFESQSMRDWLLSLAKVDSGLCIALFYDGDELAAFNLSFVDIGQKAFYYYIPSFSDKYLSYSLGTWLLVETLKHHAPTGGGNFRLDLLCGDEGYKKMWSTDRYHVWRVILFPGGLSNLPEFYFYKAVYGLKSLKNRFQVFRKQRKMGE